MANGVIGIFREEVDELTGRCSVSVREMQTREELENQFKSEHKNVKVYLDRMFTFECNGSRTEVETALRKLLVQAFGKYGPYEQWENYTVEEYSKFIDFMENLFQLTEKIMDIKKIES